MGTMGPFLSPIRVRLRPVPIPSPLATDTWQADLIDRVGPTAVADTWGYTPTGVDAVGPTAVADTWGYTPTGVDAVGPTAASDSVGWSYGATGARPAYVSSSLLSLAPTFYWPLGEGNGAVAYDWSGAGNFALVHRQDVQIGQAGPSTTYPSYQFLGAGITDLPAVQVGVTVPGTCTQVAFFQTAATAPGILMQMGNNATWGGWQAGSYGHTLWITSNNQSLAYGEVAGSLTYITGAPGINDNRWHMVAAARDSTGLYLYLDGGTLIASTTAVTESQGQSGTWWWSIGQGNTGGWPYTVSNFTGKLSQVLFFNKVHLTTSQLNAIYTAIL